MKRFAALSAVVLLLPAVGCMTITPVGPLWGKGGAAKQPEKMTPSQMIDELKVGAPTGKATAPADESPVPEGTPPPPPAKAVGPDDITAENRGEAVRKLQGELDEDRRTLDAMPNYPTVSRPTGRR